MKPKRRLPGEWEPQRAIQFTFPHPQSDWATRYREVVPVFVALVEAVCRFQSAVVVCHDRAAVIPLLKQVPQARLDIYELPSNDSWARDHGPITIWENGRLVLLDFNFNGWGLKFPADQDNQLSRRLHAAGAYGPLEHRLPGLVLEGGGIETDGAGTLLATTECLLSPNRNPHLSQAELEQQLQEWLGCDRFLWLQHGALEGDDTDAHIDTLARFCNPTTIAYVRCDDPEDLHFRSLQRMEKELQAFRQRNGAAYQLVPLPWPAPCYAADGHRLPATYANFLMLNEAVLVPTYRVPQDAQAISILETLFPDRSVIGIDCRLLIEQHGSLHCVTMQLYG